MNTIADVLNDKMSEHGWRDENVAVALAEQGVIVSSATVRKWRLGETEPQARNIRPLAVVLGVTAGALLGLEPVA